eukprot:1399058-Prymnesium_polylepis.1
MATPVTAGSSGWVKTSSATSSCHGRTVPGCRCIGSARAGGGEEGCAHLDQANDGGPREREGARCVDTLVPYRVAILVSTGCKLKTCTKR